MSDGREDERSGERSGEATDERLGELQEMPIGFSSPEPVDQPEPEPEPEHVEPPPPPVVDVTDLDWPAVHAAVDATIAWVADRARMSATLDRLEMALDDERGMRMLFDGDRADANDRAIHVRELDDATPLWFVGDLHGDLLALEAALALVRRDTPEARLVFLGDLFDDGGYGLEVLLRVFALIVEQPDRTCLIAGNHDEALGFGGARFVASVSPSDFTDTLNAQLADGLVTRAGVLATRLFARVPRALFFPDGLLVAHGGIPLTDLHEALRAGGDFNDPRCLQDFTWTRAHSRARHKIPNRASRGSQYGYEDFAAFCEVSRARGRPIWRIVRGHDHEEERFAIPPAWAARPLLTTVALSRRLPRESFGPDVRVPTIARWVPGALPQVHRLHIPAEMIRELFPAQPEEPDVEEDEAPDEGGDA